MTERLIWSDVIYTYIYMSVLHSQFSCAGVPDVVRAPCWRPSSLHVAYNPNLLSYQETTLRGLLVPTASDLLTLASFHCKAIKFLLALSVRVLLSLRSIYLSECGLSPYTKKQLCLQGASVFFEENFGNESQGPKYFFETGQEGNF